MARPTKPDHVKEAQGTLQPCRVNDSPAVGDALSVLPAVPDGMTEYEEKYFIWCCEDLLDKGLLTRSFAVSIERAALWYHVFATSRKRMRGGGYVQETQSGYTQITADFTAMKESHKLLSEFEGKYGLDLVSSQKISMPVRDKDDEYFD